MPGIHRRHLLIGAPVEDVWEVLSDPRSQPNWWPEVSAVEMEGEAAEGATYTRRGRRFGFLDQVDSVWVVERLDHMKEAHFRCTISGSYARFAVTPAQDDTFVEAEVGMLPPNLRWRAARPLVAGMMFGRWLRELLDALPRAVARTRSSPRETS